jgi:hypothetical protein
MSVARDIGSDVRCEGMWSPYLQNEGDERSRHALRAHAEG